MKLNVDYISKTLDLEKLKRECDKEHKSPFTHPLLDNYSGTRLPALANFDFTADPEKRTSDASLIERIPWDVAYHEAMTPSHGPHESMDTPIYYLARAVRAACEENCLDALIERIKTDLPDILY